MSTAFDQMSPEQQIDHVQDLWDRIARRPEQVPVSPEWRAEIARRLAEHKERPDEAVPWSVVEAELRAALESTR